MKQFYFSYKQVKHDYSLPRACAVICGRFNITENRDYLRAQNEGKLASVYLQQFSSIARSGLNRLCIGYSMFCDGYEIYTREQSSRELLT